MKRRGVTIVVHVDGQLDSTKYRLPMWAFEAGKWGALVIGLSVVLVFTLARPIARGAARAKTPYRVAARPREAYGREPMMAVAASLARGRRHGLRELAAEGDEVQAGQVIALTGSSGRSTAPHLHFEIRREGKSLDPLTMVREGN